MNDITRHSPLYKAGERTVGNLVDLLCSRNARPQKALVGRAQWEINQAAHAGK
jgi:hypothetical protein